VIEVVLSGNILTEQAAIGVSNSLIDRLIHGMLKLHALAGKYICGNSGMSA
jgi:hypothetical protein